MSQRIESNITCPNCSNQFSFTLYRSIWGEYPENRELVMTDKINLATCPLCNHMTKIQFPFIYTNADKFFAVWWEPEYDPQIDRDSSGYSKMMGAGNYLATAPRIKDWNEFKKTILKFEKGELQGKPGVFGKELQDQMQGFLKQTKNQNQNKHKQGCLSMLLFIILFLGTIIFYFSKLIIQSTF